MDLDEAELLGRDAPLPVRRRNQVHILGVQQLLAAHPSNNSSTALIRHQIERRERGGGGDEAGGLTSATTSRSWPPSWTRDPGEPAETLAGQIGGGEIQEEGTAGDSQPD